MCEKINDKFDQKKCGISTHLHMVLLTPNKQKSILSLFLLVFLFVFTSQISYTQNTNWNGSVSNLWSNPANWSNGVPQPGSNVTIPWLSASAHQPFIDINTTMNRLTMNSNPNTLTAADGVNIIVNDRISVGNGATLDIGNATMTVHGNSSTGGFIKLQNGTISFLGNFSFVNGGVFTVETGVINVGSPSKSATFYLGGSNTFNLNNGTFNVYGESTFAGSGVFNVDEGSVNFYDNSAFSGSGILNAGNGEFYFDNNVTINGSGQINAQNSTIIMDGSTWNLSGGGMFNPGTSTFIITGDTEIIGLDISFYNLIIEDGANVTSAVNIVVQNDLTVDENGLFNINPGKTLNVIGFVTGDISVTTNRPYIIHLTVQNENTIVGIFNESLDPVSSQNASNYRVENEAGVIIDYPTNPTLGGFQNNEVTLSLGFIIQQDVNYYLIANNITNLNNTTVSPNHKKRFGITTLPTEWIWSGNIDRDWNKAGNWIQNSIPLTYAEVIIPLTENKPIIDNTFIVINSIEIEQNASLTIGPGGSLTVTGVLNNMAGTNGLVVNSTTSGTGSLIHYTNGVSATFQRYVPGLPEAWHSLSSPLTNQQISGSFTPTGTYGDGTGYDFYLWYEPDTMWVYLLNTDYPPNWQTVNGGNNFVPGRGYLVSYQAANPTLTFSGTLNQGTVNIGVTKNPLGTGDPFGANLIGNPYPSSIDWKSSPGWNRSPLESNGGGYDVWIWNDEAENYGVYNSASAVDVGSLGVSRYIAPTQGFFVSATEPGIVSLNNSARVHNGSNNWLKTASDFISRLSLEIEPASGSGKDQVIIELGHDEAVGGTRKKFSFVQSAPSLYLPHNGTDYSLRMTGSIASNPVIPVSLKPGLSGEHTISATFDDYAFEMLLLEDRLTGIKHDLKANPVYKFKADVKDNPNRFVLHLAEGNYANPYDPLPVRVYSYKKTLYLDLRLLDQHEPCLLEIFDLMGQLVHSQNVPCGNIETISFYKPTGIYIVRVTGKGGTVSKKVYF